eukprot:GHVO01017092.1.p1 GENE.GHVO01017092.1~~GHVO01017092.1.p1  ORF type:complete len:423 (+),score=74.26 GHVO01017092.1:27-1295(+)
MEKKCIDTIRVLSAAQPEIANSGHPGAPMGCAPMAHYLWGQRMVYDPTDPAWINRDRFVLSNGHASALQYSMLHLSGYKVSKDDLKSFRQLHSITPGHPEVGVTPGVEVTTGPLGQGLSQAVGLAMASHHLEKRYNREGFPVFSNTVFCVCGDGCLQEGVTSEACSLAGHLKLGRLVVLYDSNHITIDGSTEISFTESVSKRFEAYGWHVDHVADGDADTSGIADAVHRAEKINDKPSLIIVNTTIGFGSGKQGTAKVHGAPLGKDDFAQTLDRLEIKGDMKNDHFHVSEDVYHHYKERATKNIESHTRWNAMMEEYKRQFPTEGADLMRRFFKSNDSVEAVGFRTCGCFNFLPSYRSSQSCRCSKQMINQTPLVTCPTNVSKSSPRIWMTSLGGRQILQNPTRPTYRGRQISKHPITSGDT